jgi:hypothetical protein
LKSGIAGGSKPYRSRTPSTSYITVSEKPRREVSTRVFGLTSWRASMSPVRITTSRPRSSAWSESVPSRSSASNPSSE